MSNLFSFHAGELAVQERAGESHLAKRNSPLISNAIVGGAKSFIEKLFMVVLASVDANGAVWSSVLYGQPGFMHAEDVTLIKIDVPVHDRDQNDPFWSNIEQHATIGMLFIDLGTRRRYRINGSIQHIDDQGLAIIVDEAYPNCPRYIQKRHLRQLGESVQQSGVISGEFITEEITHLIHTADTIFVASFNAQTGADASHRGGEPGFVQIINERTLRIPDFNGNSLFNTLGNIESNPNTGICIPDFDGQRLLQLTGRTKTLWDQEDPGNVTGGTHRFWEFEIDQWLLRPVAQHLEWEFLDASPYNPPAIER